MWKDKEGTEDEVEERNKGVTRLAEGEQARKHEIKGT